MARNKYKDFLKYAQERPNIYDSDGNFVDWKKHFRDKEEYLNTYYDEVSPKNFLLDIFPKEKLDTYKSVSDVLPLVALYEGTHQDEGLHSGKGTGLLKYTLGVRKDGKPITKTLTLYNDYKGVELTQNNKFALLNMCTYFGRNIYRKNLEGNYVRTNTRIPSECFGIAIDLDYVTLKQLERVFGKIECDLVPMPTYIVNSGAGLHLYYVFEESIPLKDLTMQRYLGELKRQLTNIVWTNETSLSSTRQYQGIYQDMRIPGSWTKFGYKNKSRCKYIIKAYKTGRKVDLTYLENFLDVSTLPNVDDLASTSKTKLTLEECAIRYPKWYERVVILGDTRRQQYTQNRGLYEWWKEIITYEKSPTGSITDTSHDGDRFFCIRALFVMAKKSGVPFEEVMEDAMNLIPFMNSREHTPDNEFTKDDVLEAATYYEDHYVKWSNETLERQTGIRVHLYKTSRRNGRTRKQHLAIARATQQIVNPNWRENSGRKSKEEIVKEWREKNPNGKKCDCIKETGLTKPTVYKWWNQQKPTRTNEK